MENTSFERWDEKQEFMSHKWLRSHEEKYDRKLQQLVDLIIWYSGLEERKYERNFIILTSYERSNYVCVYIVVVSQIFHHKLEENFHMKIHGAYREMFVQESVLLFMEIQL
jgi:hypothetical protein